MTPPDIAFTLCLSVAGLILAKEAFRQRIVRKERRRERAELAREDLPALATAALWQEASEARAKARQEWDDARARRDTRDEGRAAAEAREATTRVLRLEVGR
jgi:hypothetical protein